MLIIVTVAIIAYLKSWWKFEIAGSPVLAALELSPYLTIKNRALLTLCKGLADRRFAIVNDCRAFNRGGKEIRTPDPLHAICRRRFHRRPLLFKYATDLAFLFR
jgi:hypothetical protein